MASMVYTSLCVTMMILVANCSPIKRSTAEQQATIIVKVKIPDNLTHAIVTVLPLIPDMMEKQDQQIQNLTAIMNNMAQLLQSQLTILSERLPVPPLPSTPASPSTTPSTTSPMSTSPTSPLSSSPQDCQDVAAAESSSQSGVYTITPPGGLDSIQVYCDLDTDGGGWTVFQKRFDGSVYFFLGWDDYERGFGSADGEYWAGLSVIYQITQSGKWQLRIDMEAFDGDMAYATYDSFSVGPASTNYRLTIGDYSGNAGNSLAYHNNSAFSTKDRDNDVYDNSCSDLYKGAWWYRYCQQANLNGLYLGPTREGHTAMVWQHWKGLYQSLKSTEMKIRRVGAVWKFNSA